MQPNNVFYLRRTLSAFATETLRQQNVLGHDGDATRVNCAQIGVLKQAHLAPYTRIRVKTKALRNSTVGVSADRCGRKTKVADAWILKKKVHPS